MNKLKQISILAALLIVVGLAGSVFFAQEMRSSDTISEERTIEQVFSAIEITTDNAEIELLPTDSDSAQIELTGNAADYVFEADVAEDVLSIQVNTQQKKLINFNFFSDTLTLAVYVPDQLYEGIQIENQNGKVQVDGLHATDTHVETDNGRVELTNIEGTTVTTNTENGRTILENVQAALTSVKSDNGKIELSAVDGELVGKAENGSISLETEQLDRSIDLRTDNGSITITTAAEPTNVTISVDVDNGKIDVFGHSSAHTVIGDGDHVISLVTENGSVTVK